MLANEVARSYGSKVQIVVEDLGASPVADRFGIDKYPAVVVDNALVARPEDFYEWGGPGGGKYLPWSDLKNRRKFQDDLRRMIDIRLAGGKLPSLKVSKSESSKPALPALELTDLAGKNFRFADVQGKPLLVEFWATWCPPCLSTLTWLKTLDASKANVVAIAVESQRADIDKVLQQYQPRARVVVGTRDVLDAFGGIPSVPTLFLADKTGRIVRAFYGAPPTLHDDIERELAKLR